MRIEFRGNSIFTQITIIGNSRKEYDALIDTGSVKSGIPIAECRALGLKVSGTERTAGLFGEDYVPLFSGIIQIDNRQFNSQIAGLPIDVVLLGVDLLRNYNIHINWLSNPRIATAEY